MNKKKIIIISIAIMILIIIFLVVGYFLYTKKVSLPNLPQIKKQVTDLIKQGGGVDREQQSEEVANIDFSDVDANKEPVKPIEKVSGKEAILSQASSFAERFGTYSNQGNLRNITDLKIFMTRKMQAWANQYVADQRSAMGNTDTYYGITTKAVAKEIKEFDESAGIAEVLVKTRRQEATDTTNNIIDSFNQNIIIKFVKEDGAWKVDSASWQNK